MTIVDNDILSTTGTANGTWQNIGNYTALSVHVVAANGLDGDVWIEVSNNPACDPVYSSSTSASTSGVPLTGNLSEGPPETPEEMSILWDSGVTQCMVSPSCLNWKYLRACKKDGSNQTDAYLFGQIVG